MINNQGKNGKNIEFALSYEEVAIIGLQKWEGCTSV